MKILVKHNKMIIIFNNKVRKQKSKAKNQNQKKRNNKMKIIIKSKMNVKIILN